MRDFTVRPDELSGARETARRFAGAVEELRDGSRRLVAVLHRNRLEAVLLSADGFDALTGFARAAIELEEARDGWGDDAPAESDRRLEEAMRNYLERKQELEEWNAR